MSPPAHSPAVARSAHQDSGDGVIVSPRGQLPEHGFHHSIVQRIGCLRAVEGHDAEVAATLKENVFCFQSPPHQLPAGMMKLAPWRMPEGHRDVTVLVLV